ncbi:nucleoid-associated protein NdpA [Syntrophotalea carbinolica DSM 2380]|uniref:Nucleoid-associated protein NdpA n=1 Tax=Syntrophotalea carbinolica (strain DSM 2380 / NBRC 103641 / GraBd1) TaxID=338963 RepID=Q3A5W5_SYNC1|nr:nucleoid-associated protein NdpA [Syntrophotalea carbinolica DSM 2380]
MISIYKQRRAEVEIHNAIVHLVKKERHQNPDLRLREEPLPVDDKLSELITSLRKLYNEKTARGYGVFHQDTINYPLSTSLNGHLNNEVDFVEFSHNAMRTLVAKVTGVQLATGGYILLASYNENNADFLIVASIKHRPGLAFDQNLNLTGSVHIDLEHLHEMARVNVTSWLNNGERYLSFAKRRGGDDGFSDYFREFIGCEEFCNSTEMNKITLRAVKAFGDQRNLDAETRRQLHAAVFNYFDEKRLAKETVSLAALSHRIDDEQPEAFLTFINENAEEYPLGDGFDPVKNIYKGLKTFVIKDGSVKIQFNQEDFGTRVILNADQSLLIRELNPDFIRQLVDFQ